MQVSIAGILISGGLLVFVGYMRWSLIAALMGSLAFGATAIGTIGSLGGSSPLIFTVFAILLILYAAARRNIWREIGTIFGRISATWLICGLMIYGAIGAVLFPRLFAGQTSVFVASRTALGVYETALAPVSANISQTGYFILAGVTFLAACLLLQRDDGLINVRRGFFLWFGLHTIMGIMDLLGKLTGIGDVLAPIRSANYAMLTHVTEAGFWRVAGAFSEASAFGGVSLAGLSFAYTYWRKTGSRYAAALGVSLLVLLLLSTSSTAYVGLAIMSVPVMTSIALAFSSGRMRSQEALLIVLLAFFIVAALAVSLYNAHFFDPFVELIDTTVVHKMASASGQERMYWNYKSLQSFFDTGGLGVGLGSSRASSWPIALLSQLGLLGTLMMGVLLAALLRGLRGVRRRAEPEVDAIVASVRACTIAGLVSAVLASGSADPGIAFFVPLAVILTTRVRLGQERRAATVPIVTQAGSSV